MIKVYKTLVKTNTDEAGITSDICQSLKEECDGRSEIYSNTYATEMVSVVEDK